MTTTHFASDDLLDPIAGENPSGESLRFTTELDEIREARRSDDTQLPGPWEREPKLVDWAQVRELTSSALREKSKDLTLAAFYAEASVKLEGFAGLRDGLHLIRELIDRFWESLHPMVEDGDLDYRAVPLEWLAEKLPLAIQSIPVTPENAEEIRDACGELQELQGVLDGRFGRDAPSCVALKRVLDDQWTQFGSKPEGPLESKDKRAGLHTVGALEPSTAGAQPIEPSPADPWRDAEQLLCNGQVQQGVAAMAALAAQEPTGRDRFIRRLLLAEACRSHGVHTQLATVVLEELAAQIDMHHLHSWEPPQLIARVWRALRGCYSQAGPGSVQAQRATELFDRLCRLDPWHAATCGDEKGDR